MLELITDTKPKPVVEPVPMQGTARRDILQSPSDRPGAADDLWLSRFAGRGKSAAETFATAPRPMGLLWVEPLGEKGNDSAVGNRDEEGRQVRIISLRSTTQSRTIEPREINIVGITAT